MKHPTLQNLLSTPDDCKEHADCLDYAMSSLMARLRREPEQLEYALRTYESLFLLRKAIETHKAG
jgi:hypothetical protein